MFNPVTTHTKIHTVFMLQDVRQSSESKILASWNFHHLLFGFTDSENNNLKIIFKRLPYNKIMADQ